LGQFINRVFPEDPSHTGNPLIARPVIRPAIKGLDE
jgi:hypothetical protein